MRRRKCEGAKANKRTIISVLSLFRIFAISPSPFKFVEPSIVRIQIFFSRRVLGGGRMIIVFAAVGRGVRGIFLVILICEINNIEISREREGGPDPSYP